MLPKVAFHRLFLRLFVRRSNLSCVLRKERNTYGQYTC